MGKPFDSNTELAKAIRLLINKAITSRPEEVPSHSIAEPSTSKASQASTFPVIVPPNRLTVKGLRNLLIHTDFFTQIIAKSGVKMSISVRVV